MIYYRVRLADLNRHHFEVQCRIENPDLEQSVTLPSWIPGSYLLREYARHVISIRAESDGRAIEIEKTHKSTWCCRGAGAELTITAEIFALDLSVRGAYLDGRRGYFNGTCVFLSPGGREEEPVEVSIEVPEDPRCAQWRVATAMTPSSTDDRGFGRYAAGNYDELIDHPMEISDFAEIEFQAAGIPHRLIVAGRFQTDLERIAADLRQLCEAHIGFFGQPAPFDQYAFLGLAVGEGYGGLEHRASSSLIFSRDDLPKIGESGVPRNYQRFLSLCSHEYFHTWNIKRIKPAAFSPYRLDRRNHTRLMWVFEGITSYYQDLILLRCDLIGAETYLKRLGQLLTRVYRAPGRSKQSIADSSFDAWDRLYKPESNSANATISYYSKGALVAMALDLTIRNGSGATLDQVMVELWRRFGGEGRGVGEAEFESLSQEVTGMDLSDFYDRAVRGTDDIAIADLLGDFGVNLKFCQAAAPDDASGLPSTQSEPLLGLGLRYKDRPGGGLDVRSVIEGGPAESGGMNVGDLIIAIDGLRVTEKNLSKRLARLDSGVTVPVTVFRGDELLELSVALAEADTDICVLSLEEEVDGDALTRRQAWLGE